MYKCKSILALITARGGSKGIRKKNICSLGGKPLIHWTIDAAKGSVYIDRLILSSDDEQIINVARDHECEAPFVRPANLATDETSSIDVIMHALSVVEEKYDYLLLLQPTSPFRTSGQIDGAIERIVDSRARMLVSVAKLRKHPMFMYEIVDLRLKSFFKSEKQLRRQEMPPAYEHNGAIYISEIDYLRDRRSYCTDDVLAFEMDKLSSLDIDEVEDIEYAEFLIRKGRIA